MRVEAEEPADADPSAVQCRRHTTEHARRLPCASFVRADERSSHCAHTQRLYVFPGQCGFGFLRDLASRTADAGTRVAGLLSLGLPVLPDWSGNRRNRYGLRSSGRMEIVHADPAADVPGVSLLQTVPVRPARAGPRAAVEKRSYCRLAGGTMLFIRAYT